VRKKKIYDTIPVVLNVYDTRMVEIHSTSTELLWILAKFLCFRARKNNLNPIETHIHPKKSLNSDGTAPVLLFLIVHGSLSEKLVLYSTSPPDERKSHVKSILIFKERVNWR
jgi:hypothetical protein